MLLPVLALLLFVFLPWQVALALYVPIALGSLAIARKAMQAQSAPPASGREAMIGDTARVVGTGDGAAEVHYHGEAWRAVSSDPLQVGQEVVIREVQGLTLHVSSLHGTHFEHEGGST
jgi:membrane-bound serine protease (ClpP class)